VRRHLEATKLDYDHPVGGQLMGSDPIQFQAAARRLVEAGFDDIDVNFGCPSKSAVGGCRGGYHLAQPTNALEIVARVRETVPPHVPVTVKMRRGIDGSDESREKCLEILDGVFRLGAAAVTLHGRTVEQGYVGASRWAFVKEAKAAYPDRTILGSGDLFTATDCVRMLAETGVDGVSVARGAIGNPWIFREARSPAPSRTRAPAAPAQREVLAEHLRLAPARSTATTTRPAPPQASREVRAAAPAARGRAQRVRPREPRGRHRGGPRVGMPTTPRASGATSGWGWCRRAAAGRFGAAAATDAGVGISDPRPAR
jgi:tRNA-dihydrouridine synthase